MVRIFRIRIEYGQILRISPCSVRMREIQTRKSSNTDTHAVQILVIAKVAA